MAAKKRKKPYRPKRSSANFLLAKLPMPADVLKNYRSKTEKSLLRMRLNGINVADSLACVIHFGTAWLAADRMEETEGLRELSGDLIEALGAASSSGGEFPAELFTRCTEALDTTYAVLSHLTTAEYLAVTNSLRAAGTLPLVDKALALIEDSAKAGRIPSGTEIPV